EGTARPRDEGRAAPSGREVPLAPLGGDPRRTRGERQPRTRRGGREPVVVGRLRAGHADRRPLPHRRRPTRRRAPARLPRLPAEARVVIDFESYRDEFPVVGPKSYLISASLGPVSRRSRRYLDEYLDAWAAKGAPDNVWFEDIFPRMHQLKDTFGALIGADHEELAITVNVSLALAAVMSCIDFTKRHKIILSELDFPTDGHVSLANRARGAEVVFLKAPDGISVPLEAYRDAIDEDTALVFVNRVLYRSSALLDAKEICRMARGAGA